MICLNFRKVSLLTSGKVFLRIIFELHHSEHSENALQAIKKCDLSRGAPDIPLCRLCDFLYSCTNQNVRDLKGFKL